MVTKTKLGVTCPYSEKCSDANGCKCVSCLNNENRSYYRPVEYWNPWYLGPYYPYWYPNTITYTTCGVQDNMPVQSYYAESH